MKPHRLLASPLKVFFLCCVFFVGSLLWKGGWISLYSLYRDEGEIQSQMVRLRTDIDNLDLQMKRAKDPSFIERQALDQLDMASDHDLVFVFSE